MFLNNYDDPVSPDADGIFYFQIALLKLVVTSS